MRAIFAASRRSTPLDDEGKKLRLIVDTQEKELATLRDENRKLREENARLLMQRGDTLRNENSAPEARIQKEDGGAPSRTLLQPVKEPAVETDGDSDSDDAPKVGNEAQVSRRRNYGPSPAGSIQTLSQSSVRSSSAATTRDAAAADVPAQVIVILASDNRSRPAFATSRRGESSRRADDATSTPLFGSIRSSGSFKKRSPDLLVSPEKAILDFASQSPHKQEGAQQREEDNQAGTLTALSEALGTRNSGIMH